jgi:hypothetical protein
MAGVFACTALQSDRRSLPAEPSDTGAPGPALLGHVAKMGVVASLKAYACRCSQTRMSARPCPDSGSGSESAQARMTRLLTRNGISSWRPRFDAGRYVVMPDGPHATALGETPRFNRPLVLASHNQPLP